MSREIRQADFTNQKALLDTAMMTMKAMDNVIVSRAMTLVDTLYPDRNTIIQVLDAAFALRYFELNYFRPPSSNLKRYAVVLYRHEQGLLMVHEPYELQAQLARIPLEDLPTLSGTSRWLVRGAGIISLQVKIARLREQLPLHTTRKLLQALEALALGVRQGFFKKVFHSKRLQRHQGKRYKTD